MDLFLAPSMKLYCDWLLRVYEACPWLSQKPIRRNPL